MSTGLMERNGHGTALAEIEGEGEFAAPVEMAGRAEIDVQVATAKRYPRSAQKAFNEAISLVTLTPKVAALCTYYLPKGGGITGKSVRLAEMVATAWGNLRTSGRIVHEDSRFITAEGVCLDVEKNNGFAVQVRVRITDRNGRKYNEDMIAQTGNAAISKAVRNAIFRVVPGAFSEEVWEASKACAAGDMKGLADRRSAAISHFVGKGVAEARIFAALGVVGIADVGMDELLRLEGYRVSLKDGFAKVDELFPPIEPDAPKAPAKGSAAVLEEIKGKSKAKASPPAQKAGDAADDSGFVADDYASEGGRDG